MRKACGQVVVGVMHRLWENLSVCTQRFQQFYNMGIKARFMSSLYQFLTLSFTQVFLARNTLFSVFIPTFHRTNNVYNKGN